MRPDTTFDGDDLRRHRPEIPAAAVARYLDAVRQLDEFAERRFGRRVIQLAVRWMLDQGISVALWGGRRPDQLQAALGVAGWSLQSADREQIEHIVNMAIPIPSAQSSWPRRSVPDGQPNMEMTP